MSQWLYHKSKKTIMIENAKPFVLERFPHADVIRYSIYGWVVVVDPHLVKMGRFEGARDKKFIGVPWQYIGRLRYDISTAWNSAKLEIEKYESGKKTNVIMEKIVS